MSDSTDKTAGPLPNKAASKPASAAYPVDEAELNTQQERLRKAAAAGAHALKSPLASVLSRAPARPPAAPQEAQSPPGGSPQAAVAPEAVPKAGHAPVEVPVPAANTVQTEESEQVVAELRKISALTKGSLVSIVVLIVAVAVLGLIQHGRNASLQEASATHKSDWSDVERDLSLGEFEQAIALGEELIQRTPQYPEAHQRLAGAYLAAGKLDKAKEHYAEAFRLFPSEQNQKLLNALETRSNGEKP